MAAMTRQCLTFFLPYGPDCIICARVLQVSMRVLAGSLQALLDQQDGVGQDSGAQLGEGTHHKELPCPSLAVHLVSYITQNLINAQELSIICLHAGRQSQGKAHCLCRKHHGVPQAAVSQNDNIGKR